MMRLAALLGFLPLLQDAVPLRLEYKPGDREELRFDLDMKMVMEISSDAVQLKQGMDGKILFTLRTACKEAGKDRYLFEAMFTDLDMDQKVEVGDQTVKIRVKGRDVRMEGADGEVLVDTEKGLNPNLAEPMLKEMEGFGVAADLEMDARGLIKEAKKGKRLPKLLQGVAASGNLYPFVLPEKPVGVGDAWVYENELTSLGELKLSGKPIKVPLRYRLERFEGEGAARVAIFSTKVDTELKDIECEGKMEGVAGDVTLKIRTLSYRGTGETRFRPASGRVETSALDLTLKAEMSADAQELGGEMTMKMSMGLKARIAPAAAKKKREF